MGAMSIVSLIGTLRKYQDKLPGYLIAVAVLAFALGFREAIDPYIKIPYVTLFPAMIICSLVGGRAAGILAAIIGGLVAWFLWLPPRGTFALEWPSGHLTVALYILTSTILLLLMRGLNETLKALESERDLSADLFRELQHRTANNLQSISAMLLQNRNAIGRDPSLALGVIDTAHRRFEIMSRINRRLYSPDPAARSLRGYQGRKRQ
jgi:K+-sensing histidine kinase KdpD